MALDTRESIPEISVFHVHRQEALDLVEIAEFYLSPTLAHHSVRLIRLPIVKTIKNRQRERERRRDVEDRHGTWVDEYFSTDSGGGYLTPRRVDVGLPKACDSSAQRALYAPNRLCSNLFPLPRARIPLPAKERRLGSPRRVYLCSLNLAKLPILIKIKTSPTVQNLAVYNPFPRVSRCILLSILILRNTTCPGIRNYSELCPVNVH